MSSAFPYFQVVALVFAGQLCYLGKYKYQIGP